MAREELCAWGVCQSLPGWLGASVNYAMALLIFLRLTLFQILLQGLSRMSGQLFLLCPLLRSEDCAGLLVSFPEGMFSCKPGWELGIFL